jgi:hypothetical protein
MTAEIVHLEDAGAKFERDRKAFRLAIEGTSVRQIAEDLHCSPSEVEASLIRMSGGVTPRLRERTVSLGLERLDALMKIYFLKAEGGDIEAAAMVLRLMERQARFLGLDIQPRGESALNDMRPQPASATDRIMEALNRLADGQVIEGEVIKGDDA